MKNKIKILGIAGSIREGSYNLLLLKATKLLLNENIDMEIFDLKNIPMYNVDIEDQLPDVVKQFKRKIVEADIVLIATPEYNYSISGVLKNALDWASRPKGQNSFEAKPVGIMGVSGGSLGTSRAQYHLRQIGVALDMRILNRPEIMVASGGKKFADDGTLNDEMTKDMIRSMINNLVKMID